MVGKLGEVSLEVARIRLLEDLAAAAVERGPAPRRQLLVERLADQRVPEAALAGRVRHVEQDPVGDRLVERRADAVLAVLADGPEHVDREVAAERRRQRQQLEALAGEVIEPAADDLAHARRHDEPPGARHLFEPPL